MEDFTAYLQSKNLSPITIKEYTRQITLFKTWYDKDIINTVKKDILSYLSHLKNTKNLQAISRNNALIALRHYFDSLINQNEVITNPAALIILQGLKKRKLHYTYNPEELAQLADNYYQLYVKSAEEKKLQPKRNIDINSYYAQMRNYNMLLFFIYQGLTTREVLALTTDDIELHKATIRIAAGTRGKERTMPLQAAQIGALMQYLHKIRPQLASHESNILFLPTTQGSTSHAVIALIKLSAALKQIDKNYNSFAQLRASLITYWIQTYGLRKAQYFAGHKSINSTEEFLPNDIENLTEDIVKFNPF